MLLKLCAGAFLAAITYPSPIKKKELILETATTPCDLCNGAAAGVRLCFGHFPNSKMKNRIV